MKLADFITSNRKAIVKEWVRFASTLQPASATMTTGALRDHADEILTAVVADMEEPQGREEQSAKSHGQGNRHRLEAVGKIHAILRVERGFRLDQLVAEYRALRASILRMWGSSGPCDISEVTRFNEAIDEALTEATTRYSQSIDETRDQFLGILGHDLRNPITGIMLSAGGILMRSAGLDATSASRILTSAGRMERMVTDLLDLTRSRLGGGIPVTRVPMDLEALLREMIAEQDAAAAGRDLRLSTEGDLSGEWDRDRIAQVISNLLGNAIQHGTENMPVRLTARGLGDTVVVEVVNQGVPIPPSEMETIFKAMVQGGERSRRGTSLGLGLYIARAIATAHGGTLTAASTAEQGTTFTLRLPRQVVAGRDDSRDT
jgi:signal transduction histidine kinase